MSTCNQHHPTFHSDSILEFDRCLVQRLINESGYEQPDMLPGQLIKALRIAWEQELTPTQRRYMNCYYLRRMTMADIAADCGVNVSTVSRTLQRGRQRLTRTLHPFLYGTP